VFFHGGGFAHCNANSTPYDFYCRKLAREIGAVVVSVDYRLAPEHKYPAQFEDGLDTLKFLDANGEEWLPECSDLSSCFLAGDSAGANLAHHVAVRACNYQFQQLKLGGVVAIQPFLGGEERTEWEHKELGILPVSRADWFWKCFLPEGCNRDHEAVNVSGPNALDISSLHNFPETMVIIGKYDSLQVWQRRYCDYLRRNRKQVRQIEFPKRLHGFFLFPEFTESAQVILDMKNFIDDHINRVL
jgi:acetyl esterase/lipase